MGRRDGDDIGLADGRLVLSAFCDGTVVGDEVVGGSVAWKLGCKEGVGVGRDVGTWQVNSNEDSEHVLLGRDNCNT